jgi:endogenous inhibitor of DNA gyrase (YacG/DUF329 family)
MPPSEPCPHCGTLIWDWHNEWHDRAQRTAIYYGIAAMDCPHCRRAVLWIESRDLTPSPAPGEAAVYQRSAAIAAEWVPVREPNCAHLAGYIAKHSAGQQYARYWQQNDVQKADDEVAKPCS